MGTWLDWVGFVSVTGVAAIYLSIYLSIYQETLGLALGGDGEGGWMRAKMEGRAEDGKEHV